MTKQLNRWNIAVLQTSLTSLSATEGIHLPVGTIASLMFLEPPFSRFSPYAHSLWVCLVPVVCGNSVVLHGTDSIGSALPSSFTSQVIVYHILELKWKLVLRNSQVEPL